MLPFKKGDCSGEIPDSILLLYFIALKFTNLMYKLAPLMVIVSARGEFNTFPSIKMKVWTASWNSRHVDRGTSSGKNGCRFLAGYGRDG